MTTSETTVRIARHWWRGLDRTLLAVFVTLLVAGVVLSFAASPPVADRIGAPTFHFVERHAAFLIPAGLVMLACSLLTPRGVRRVAIIVLGVSLALLVATLFLGTEINGSRRWIDLGFLNVQPSEFMKPAFAVICAWLFAEQQRRPDIPGNFFAMMLLIVVVALLVAQPDLGQTVLVTATWGGLFFMAGLSWLWIVLLGGLAAGGFAFAYSSFSHVSSRIDRFLTGQGDTYQTDTAREAILHGGWFGQGPGEGTVKRLLPDSHTDFVFAVVAEEFGIIVCLLLASLFAVIVLRGLSVAANRRDAFERLSIAGLVLIVGFQSIINMSVNLQLMPAKGMTLPFISYGGSSLLSIAMSAGFLLALTRKRPENRSATDRLVQRSAVLHGLGSKTRSPAT